METLFEMLEENAAANRGKRAFTFLGEDGEESVMTYDHLRSQAVLIATELASCTKPGDRALLVYPTGLDFVAAFFGCIYAGVLPVPATYPRPRRPMPRLSAIAADCYPSCVLTTEASLKLLDVPSVAPELAKLRWLATDQLATDQLASRDGIAKTRSASPWSPPASAANDLAFLQYTSGSTSQPKGVMVSHANLIHNIAMIRHGNDAGDVTQRTGAFWLPAYHDMGLICGILGVISEGGHSVLMSPTSFLQRPLRWLQAVSDYKAAVSGAPNFAYEFCARKVSPGDLVGLDLSCWKVAFCSGEPVRGETLNQFATVFGPAGFDGGAFYPCYGLAEATLMAAGNVGPSLPKIKHVSREALAEHRAVEITGADLQGSRSQSLVDCGQALLGQEIAIVDPDSSQRLDDDCVGEIWIKGPSVAKGYWQREEELAQTFAAKTDDGNGPFLRTGDLGFLSNGRLFVTGRIKDVIIIRGQNHYPQDIEATVESSHDALMFGAGAAFAVDAAFGERLVVVNEIDRHCKDADLNDVVNCVRQAVTATHELEVAAVVLIRQASLPRTTSGKQQRSLCKKMFESGELKVVQQWLLPVSTGEVAKDVSAKGQLTGAEPAAKTSVRRPPSLPARLGKGMDAGEVARFADQIESWLIDWLVQRGGISPSDAMRNRPFADYGIDSLAAVELTQELEDWLGVQVSAVIAWRYPTPQTLAQFLAQETCGGPAVVEATAVPRRRTIDDFSQLLAEVQATSDVDARQELEETGR
ncbi:MAG: AMP-binding protein [Pirellulaceae bacterium]